MGVEGPHVHLAHFGDQQISRQHRGGSEQHWQFPDIDRDLQRIEQKALPMTADELRRIARGVRRHGIHRNVDRRGHVQLAAGEPGGEQRQIVVAMLHHVGGQIQAAGLSQPRVVLKVEELSAAVVGKARLYVTHVAPPESRA